MLRGIGTYGVCVSGLIIWGCSAVLGIEDLGSAPRLGTAGSSGNAGDENGGSSGADASAGGTSTGGRITGTGARPGSGGTASGGQNNAGSGGFDPDASVGGAGGIGAGGAGGVTSGGAGGQNTGGGQGGSGGATGSTVNGKVIDFWGHPVPNVIIIIGSDQTSTETDGTFTMANVGATYDVSLVASFGSTSSGWIYQGLTRKDPTLQIDQAFDYHQADTYATIAGVTFPMTNQAIGYGFASPHGSFLGSIDESPENLWYVYYYGPATTTGGAHAIRWTVDPATLLPVTYKAYDTVQVTMVESPTHVNFNLALGDDANITTGTISGVITTGASTRQNHLYARFGDNSAVELVSATGSAAVNNYSYKVPTIPNAGLSMTMAAVAGELGYPPLAIAYKDNLAAGQTANLTIPSPAALLAPVDGSTTVNAATSFSWSGTTGVSVFTVWVDPFNTSNAMHIVTTAKTAKLPSFPLASYSIQPNTDCTWFVETHDNYATVDAAAGPTGFLAMFEHHTPEGPRRGDGAYAESVHRDFTSQ